MKRPAPMAHAGCATDTGAIAGGNRAASPGNESAEATWHRILMRVRSSDPEGATEFASTYRCGVRLLFRRYVGSIGIDSIVDEAVAGAVEEVRRGWIREPRDLVRFVREVIQRHQRERQNGSNGFQPVGTLSQGVTERMRLRKKAALLEEALRHFSPGQRSALERYYLKGEPLVDVLASGHLSSAEFDQLKGRLYRIANRTQAKSKLAGVPNARAAASGLD